MALLLEPSLFPPHWLLAQINMHASRWDEAIVHLNEVIRQAPLVPECFERRAKCYSNLGRTAEAAIDLRTSASLRKRKPG
jgi:lipopolysaccharide biosynthesis regulator YciM